MVFYVMETLINIVPSNLFCTLTDTKTYYVCEGHEWCDEGLWLGPLPCTLNRQLLLPH